VVVVVMVVVVVVIVVEVVAAAVVAVESEVYLAASANTRSLAEHGPFYCTVPTAKDFPTLLSVLTTSHIGNNAAL